MRTPTNQSKTMDEESGTPSTPSSDFASAQTEIVKNHHRTESDDTTEDAARTVDESIPAADEYVKKISLGSSSAATPEPNTPHLLSNSQLTSSPGASTTASEVERLRAEAERIKAEQHLLEEEIRLARLKKEQLAKEVRFQQHQEEEDDAIEIYCDAPVDVMSAITEDHRTLMLRQENELEVMSQITEARTEARYWRNQRKEKKFMIAFGCILLLVVIAGFVAGAVAKKNGVRGSNNEQPDGGVESNESMVVDGGGDGDGSKPTASPTDVPTTIDLTGSGVIDVTNDDTSIAKDSPTLSPITSSPSYNTIYASRVKLQSNNEAILNVFEVQVLNPSGINIATNKNTSQSSTWGDNAASNAVDGLYDTFSSTLDEEDAWWEVDLDDMTPIESITIVNRWCFDETDQINCLGRLSDSTLRLLDQNGDVVSERDIGDTTGQYELEFTFDTTSSSEIGSSVAPSIVVTQAQPSSATTSTSKSPTQKPSISPIQLTTSANPTKEPSASPTQTMTQIPLCSSDEALLTVSFAFGSDPSQVSWAVREECTEIVVTICNECYQDYEPNSKAVSYNCLPLDTRYTFSFQDPAGDVWPIGSGFSVEFGASIIKKLGNGGSMPDTSRNFGGGAPCPTSSPTSMLSMVRFHSGLYASNIAHIENN